MRLTPEQKFWSKVEILDKDSCWNWKRALSDVGYGIAYFKGNLIGAHRLAWILKKGPIPEGMMVCHRCDNKKCCNPNHHFLGSNHDNMKDLVAKGLSNKGEKNGRAKLTRFQVCEIRKLNPMSGEYTFVARMFNVSRKTIQRIVKKTHWK